MTTEIIVLITTTTGPVINPKNISGQLIILNIIPVNKSISPNSNAINEKIKFFALFILISFMRIYSY